MSQFNLVLCEIHLPAIHGKTRNSCPDIERHFLLIDKFHPTGRLLAEYYEYVEEDTDIDSFASDSEDEEEEDAVQELVGDQAPVGDQEPVEDQEPDDTDLNQIQHLYASNYQMSAYFHHPTIRNYYNIIHREDYIKPEIGLCILLPTSESIVIIKTVWIKIIQRKWKKVFVERKRIIREMSTPTAIYMRSIGARQHAMPGLKGMLSGLKCKDKCNNTVDKNLVFQSY